MTTPDNPDVTACQPRPAASPAATGSATFLVNRERYPEWFNGFNECGPTWTSLREIAERIHGNELVMVMQRIQNYEYHARDGEIAAVLLPPADVSDPRRA